MSNLLLEGEVDTREETLRALRTEVEQLRQEVRTLRIEKSTAHAAISALRQQLNPLYRSLQMLWGEIDATVPDDSVSPATGPVSGAKAAAWESWKHRLGGQKAKCIDAFLTHGALTQTQLRVVVGCANSSVPGLISDLKQLGLIEKNGSKYALRAL